MKKIVIYAALLYDVSHPLVQGPIPYEAQQLIIN